MRIESQAAQQVMHGVEFRSIPDGIVDLHKKTGFLVVSGEWGETTGGQCHSFIGFGVSGWQEGRNEVADTFQTVTALIDIEKDLRTVDRQGKGIGARMYNTPQAVAGAAEQYEHVGAYVFSLDPHKIRDMRRGRVAQALHHGSLKAAAMLLGEETAIEIQDRRLRGNHGLLYDQTIAGQREKRQHRQPDSAIPERMIVLTKPGAIATKIGDYYR